jgi:hypothetical protein
MKFKNKIFITVYLPPAPKEKGWRCFTAKKTVKLLQLALRSQSSADFRTDPGHSGCSLFKGTV